MPQLVASSVGLVHYLPIFTTFFAAVFSLQLLTALHVAEEVCAPVAHRQVVLTILKRLRLHARFDRNLMGKLAHCAWTCIQKEVRRHLGRDDLVPRYGRDHTDNRADRTRSGVLPYRLLPLFGSLLQSLCLILVIADMTSTRM